MERESNEAMCSSRIGSSSFPGCPALLEVNDHGIFVEPYGPKGMAPKEKAKESCWSAQARHCSTPEDREVGRVKKGEMTQGLPSEHAASESLHSQGP
jgi:hypothetical protein